MHGALVRCQRRLRERGFQFAELVFQLHDPGHEIDAALVFGRRHRDAPAFAGFAQDAAFGHRHRFEQHFVVVRFARHLAYRFDAHAVGAHVDEHEAQAAMGLAVRLGADQREAPFGQVRLGGPDLAAVDKPAGGFGAGPGAHGGQVGAGLGLGVALAPDLAAIPDARQEQGLLRGRAEAQQGGREDRVRNAVDGLRRVQARAEFMEGDQCGRGQFAAAVFARPGQGDQIGLAQHAIPGLAAFRRVRGGVRIPGAQPRERRPQPGVGVFEEVFGAYHGDGGIRNG
ncbi:hypothetical protein D9M68_545740 [compost metagenome]